MTGSQMREIRRELRMDRLAFARLIGYTGTDRNDALRVKRHENGKQIPLYLARLLWLITVWTRRTGELPEFPSWPGYDFDHTPDPAHGETA